MHPGLQQDQKIDLPEQRGEQIIEPLERLEEQIIEPLERLEEQIIEPLERLEEQIIEERGRSADQITGEPGQPPVSLIIEAPGQVMPSAPPREQRQVIPPDRYRLQSEQMRRRPGKQVGHYPVVTELQVIRKLSGKILLHLDSTRVKTIVARGGNRNINARKKV
jgi:hypothetical protein